jgi:SAM-dependent MidA family methyltransferase
LYGPRGFFRATTPSEHFRTSVHASPLFATAIGALARAVDDALGNPGDFALVDVGAGGGELLAALAAADVPDRWSLAAVEVAGRPHGLPERVEWRADLPESMTGLVVANEWLDNVPCDVVEADADGVHLVEVVVTTGRERLAGPPDATRSAWLARWWPLAAGERAEIGVTRDAAWAAVVRRLTRGVAVAIDYGHELASRPGRGTLTGYRDGRQVAPVPDATCDITAHVAFDACAAAGTAAGATATALLTQRAALRRLGISGARPPIETARTDPGGYLRALSRAGEAAELTDPTGLGSYRWLLQSRGVELPAC